MEVMDCFFNGVYGSDAPNQIELSKVYMVNIFVDHLSRIYMLKGFKILLLVHPELQVAGKERGKVVLP